MSRDASRALEDLARDATRCRECFELGEVDGALIDIAQPRWIGRDYQTARFRVVVLMCNPGEGLNYVESCERTRLRLYSFRQGTVPLDAVLKDQRDAQWLRFYVENLQLNVDEVAFANVAWCATKGNRYPRTVLNRCFERHTEPLLQLLRPDVVFTAGGGAQAFSRRVAEVVGSPKVLSVLHHAHRKGRQLELSEFARLREELDVARMERRSTG